MKNFYLPRIKILFTIICIYYNSLYADDFGNFDDLTLEISSKLKEILPMEPLPITITLSNTTKKSIISIASINPGAGFIKFYTAEGQQPFKLFESSDWLLKSVPRVEKARLPGFKISVTGYYFYAHPENLDKENRGRYLFENPGVYRIKAIFTDSKIDKSIESNILSIEVKEPNETDAAAYQFIKNIQDDKNKEVYYGNFLLLSSASEKSEIQNKQEEFIKKFPNSEYSRFLYYSIGTRCLSEKVQDTQRGINYLEKAANYYDFLFAEDSILKLIKTFTETGQPDKAREYKEILAKRFPDSSEGRQYIEDLVIASQEQAPKTVQAKENEKEQSPQKSLGIALPIIGAAVAVIVIAGLVLFSRKKKLNKSK